jgi:hypothetical protein
LGLRQFEAAGGAPAWHWLMAASLMVMLPVLLVFPPDLPFVYVEAPRGERMAELFIPSSIHPLNRKKDDQTRHYSHHPRHG